MTVVLEAFGRECLEHFLLVGVRFCTQAGKFQRLERLRRVPRGGIKGIEKRAFISARIELFELVAVPIGVECTEKFVQYRA